MSRIFAVIARLPFLKTDVAFDLENLREKLAKQEKNQPRVNRENADFLFRELETLQVRGNQIEQKHSTQQPSARQNGDFPVRAFRMPPDENVAKKFRLHFIKA